MLPSSLLAIRSYTPWPPYVDHHAFYHSPLHHLTTFEGCLGKDVLGLRLGRWWLNEEWLEEGWERKGKERRWRGRGRGRGRGRDGGVSGAVKVQLCINHSHADLPCRSFFILFFPYTSYMIPIPTPVTSRASLHNHRTILDKALVESHAPIIQRHSATHSCGPRSRRPLASVLSARYSRAHIPTGRIAPLARWGLHGLLYVGFVLSRWRRWTIQQRRFSQWLLFFLEIWSGGVSTVVDREIR